MNIMMTTRNPAGANSTNTHVSPLTLDETLNDIEKIVITMILGVTGIILNGFFIATFFTDTLFSKKAYIFLPCAGFGDFMISGGIFPAIAVILLSQSNDWKTQEVCHAMMFIAISSTYIYSLCFFMTALETFIRVCRPLAEYESFMKLNFGTVILSILSLSLILAGIGIYRQYDLDYCYRDNKGDFNYRLITNFVFHIAPGVVTLLLLTIASITLIRRGRILVYRRSLQHEIETTMCINNLASFSVYIVCWLPFLIVTMLSDHVISDRMFYYSAWLPMCRAVFPALIYTIFDKSFRNAYAEIFYYVCCKDPLRSRFTRRHRRAHDQGPAQVHMLQRALYGHRAAAAPATCETQAL